MGTWRRWAVPFIAAAIVLVAIVTRPSSESPVLVLDESQLPDTLDEAALVRRPPGAAAGRVVLLLHGAGSSAANFLDVAEEISGQGFVALVVRGPRQLGPGRYTWSSIADTHALLRRTLALANRQLHPAPERPILIGYSLGATLAVNLLAQYPDVYASAFAISPGPLADDHVMQSVTGRPLVILVGAEDGPSERAVEGIERAWTNAHEALWIVHHPGDHRPPDDWRDRCDDAMTWIAVKASS
jgi:predicted esterase